MRRLWALLLLGITTPAGAERLEFDHRLHPALKSVLDAGDRRMVDFDAKNPARLVDLIAVKGVSARKWTEALEIISIVRPADIATAKDWMLLLEQQSQARCSSQFTILSEDSESVTFERRSPGCASERAPFGLYRLVAGKRSWFQLAVLTKSGLNDSSRNQWLALLASAQLR